MIGFSNRRRPAGGEPRNLTLSAILLFSVSLIGLSPSRAPGQPFATAAHYATGSQPSHVEVGDLNGDGTLDLVTSHANSVSVLLGTGNGAFAAHVDRSEEHTSELQSPCNLVCRLLLEKKKNIYTSFLFNLCLHDT